MCLQCGLPINDDLLSSEGQLLEMEEKLLTGFTSPGDSGRALPGAYTKYVSFPLHREPVHFMNAPSYALNEWLHHQSVGNDVLNIRLPLVYEVLILLFASYLGNNALKSFANMNKMRESALRRKFCAFANRHYSKAITALRMHISVLSDYDVIVALKALGYSTNAPFMSLRILSIPSLSARVCFPSFAMLWADMNTLTTRFVTCLAT